MHCINRKDWYISFLVFFIQYILETFYEERSTSWKKEPYINQTIDGPSNGEPPIGWDISVTTPDIFQTKQTHLEIPHTASINVSFFFFIEYIDFTDNYPKLQYLVKYL